MQQREEESPKYFVQRFLYNLQKTKKIELSNETVRTLFLKGIRDEYLVILNLMGFGDISHFLITYIYELCRKYSRSRSKYDNSIHDPIS